ncbi:MAG: fumarylacetoacetate hydrolase family protein [Synergistaceae bacterium]|nr:fumarylacetoacetate hydrolase family protein [Synergistaceae bacterium]
MDRKFLRCVHDGEVIKGYIEGDNVFPIQGEFWEDFEAAGGKFPVPEIEEWLPPVVPSKLIAIGLNYRAHAMETNFPIPEEPISFLKSTTSLTGHNTDIFYPVGLTHAVDYEAELAVVMGKYAYKVNEKEALDYVFGYTCANDVSARDIQKRDGQWMLAKSFNTFNPLGPWIVCGISPMDLRVVSRLNGETRQDSRTSDLIFSIPYLISFLSQVMPLLPGDVIITGTPSGIGRLKEGDNIEIEVEGIGTLSNTVKLP